IGLAMALQMTKGYSAAEVEASWVRAYRLCQQAGPTGRLFPALQGLCRYYFLQAQYARARELAEDLLKLPERELNPGFVVPARYALGPTLYHQGKPTEALPQLEQAVAVEVTAERRSASYRYDVLDPWVIAQLYLARTWWLLGYARRAEEQCQEALRTAE